MRRSVIGLIAIAALAISSVTLDAASAQKGGGGAGGATLAAYANQPDCGLIVFPHPKTIANRRLISSLAIRHRMPAVYHIDISLPTAA